MDICLGYELQLLKLRVSGTGRSDMVRCRNLKVTKRIQHVTDVASIRLGYQKFPPILESDGVGA